MVNMHEALKRLNYEKDYEDKLASDLMEYFIASVDGINELSESEKVLVKEKLKTISHESQIHSQLFNGIIQMVVEDGNDQY